MHPKLFEIPFIHLTIQSYGTMMVIGFLAALWVMRRMARWAGLDGEVIGNAGLYALISGLVGSKLFYVVHHYDQFRGNLASIFSGSGFEFLGGVIFAGAVLLIYLRKMKMPLMMCLDILAIGLMIGSGFGRIGCLLNGCCYGKVTDSPIGIRFPYDSLAYNSQVRPDPARNRTEPLLKIDDDFFGWLSPDKQSWIPARPDEKYEAALKPYTMLTDRQKELVAGPYRCLKVYPTQPIESGYAFTLAGLMYGFWRLWASRRPGLTMATVMWGYGILRLWVESLRDDNPFEYAWWTLYKGGTVSQNISIYLILFGVGLMMFVLLKAPRIDITPKKK
ncbi:MAG: prolipoprotein diacylglyceryl transferase [Sedimentisphaerales bacterium]|nr:prolipoprotein diacylglyceryl transferase [Sedimentisphaerales bacterium]